MNLYVGGLWSPEKEEELLSNLSGSHYILFEDFLEKSYPRGQVLVIRSPFTAKWFKVLRSKIDRVFVSQKLPPNKKSLLYASLSPFPTLGGASLCIETLLTQLTSRFGFYTAALTHFSEPRPPIELFPLRSFRQDVKQLLPRVSMLITQLTGADQLVSLSDILPVVLRVPSFEFFCHRPTELPCSFECPDCPAGKAVSQATQMLSCSLFVEDIVFQLTGRRPFTIYPFIDLTRHQVERTGDKITLIRGWTQKGARLVAQLAKALPDQSFLVVDPEPHVFDGLSNVELRPATPDMRTVWRDTKVLLLPSEVAEAFGRVSVEAMSNGIPVLGTPVGGIPEAIGFSHCIDRDDVDAWIRAIRQLEDRDYYLDEARRARAKAREFDLRARLHEFVDFYAALLTGSQASMTRVFNQHEHPKVSIITSMYKAEPFLEGFIQDLEQQTFQDFEIVFIDANSPTRDIAKILPHVEKFKRVTYIRTLRREGLYASWNRGIKAAVGEYIAIANVDDRHEPQALEYQVEVLDKHPEVVLVYNDYLRVDAEGNLIKEEVAPDFDPNLLKQFCYTGTHVMVRKRVFEEVGLFDESLTVAGDYEMWLRLASKGYLFRRIPKFLTRYYDHSDTITRSNFDKCLVETQEVQRRYA